MREAADWLASRPQLGHAVFARGQGTPTPPRPQAELLVAFLEATLAMLEGREGQGVEPPPTYSLRPPNLWRIADALQRITKLLQQHPTGLPLERCLPPIPRHAPDRPIRLRAALASTFVAGLEMARDGAIALAQEHAFGPVMLATASSSVEQPASA
jgi:segregation and condensation protein A